jgi:hypothetical protein
MHASPPTPHENNITRTQQGGGNYLLSPKRGSSPPILVAFQVLGLNFPKDIGPLTVGRKLL